MIKHTRLILIQIFLFVILCSVYSANNDDPLIPGIELFLTGRLEEAENYFNAAESEISDTVNKSRKDSVVFYTGRLNLGRTKLWLGRIWLIRGDTVRAEKLLSTAAEIGESLDSGITGIPDRLRAETFRIQADALAEIMLFKGVPFIIRNGGKVQDLAETALMIDSENPDAGIIFAQGKINAPRLFGGNRREGLEILEKILSGSSGESAPLKHQIFRVFTALGDAYKDKEPDTAVEYYQQADPLFP